MDKYLVSFIQVYNMLLSFFKCKFYFINFHFTDEEISLLHMKVDLIVTLGGDGTVLWVRASNHMLCTLMTCLRSYF